MADLSEKMNVAEGMRVCAQCGASLEDRRSIAVCCSKGCTAKLRRAERMAASAEQSQRACPVCEESMAGRRSDAVACSAECRRRLTYQPRDRWHTVQCPQCRGWFTAKRSDARYCGQTCRDRYIKGTAHYRQCTDCAGDISPLSANAQRCGQCAAARGPLWGLHDLTCAVCGATFRAGARQKHCSRECGGQASRATQLAVELVKQCVACGEEFTTRDVRVVGCSTACKQWAYKYPGVRRTLVRNCRRCDEPFFGRTAAQHYCTPACVAAGGKEVRRARERGAYVEPVSRARVAERDGWVCQLCGKPVNRALRHPHPLAASLDHVVPLARGGAHSVNNCQLAHLRCNLVKGDRLPVAHTE